MTSWIVITWDDKKLGKFHLLREELGREELEGFNIETLKTVMGMKLYSMLSRITN